jgi:hypothetical protein
MGEACNMHAGDWCILIVKPEGKKPLKRPMHRWRIILK